jgi:hypothetical protein
LRQAEESSYLRLCGTDHAATKDSKLANLKVANPPYLWIGPKRFENDYTCP